MTAYATGYATVRALAVAALVAAGVAETKQQHDNMPAINMLPTDRWARISILPTETIQETFGSTQTERRSGLLVLSLFDPINEGSNGLAALADTLAPTFTRVTASTVTFQTPTPSNVGRQGQSQWWQYNLTCPFYFPHS